MNSWKRGKVGNLFIDVFTERSTLSNKTCQRFEGDENLFRRNFLVKSWAYRKD